MGTSSSYGGPKGRNPLLPPWAPEPELPADAQAPPADGTPLQQAPAVDPAQPLPPPPISWHAPKNAMTRFGRGAPGASAAPVASGFVHAHGGARTAATASREGQASVRAFGAFLGSGLSRGFAEAGRAVGVDAFVGGPPEALLAAVIDHLAPPGATVEQAAAREAFIRALAELFDQFDVEQEGLAALDRMSEATARLAVEAAVVYYIEERVLQTLLIGLERHLVDEQQANARCSELRSYIRALVALDLSKLNLRTIDFNGRTWHVIVDKLFVDAYSLMEVAT